MSPSKRYTQMPIPLKTSGIWFGGLSRSSIFMGQKITDHLTFKGGYTGHVTSGDGDFLTRDTLWDFKVSKQTLQSRSVLQLLIYWRLGLHSIHPEYRDVKYLGVYNPRMNMIYRYPVADISDEAIEELDYSIICYPRE